MNSSNVAESAAAMATTTATVVLSMEPERVQAQAQPEMAAAVASIDEQGPHQKQTMVAEAVAQVKMSVELISAVPSSASRKRKRQGEETAGGKKGKEKEKEQEKRGKKASFVYGNYNHYYGYRVLNEFGEDPRLKHFRREWFEGKDCLDVGCNAGNLTISIAKKFSCKRMVGVDIDPALVHKARKFLKCNAGRPTDIEDKSIRGMAINNLKETEAKSKCNVVNPSSFELRDEELVKRISFRAENFIECVEATALYDTVLCLSVTKWVHLNWGDDGLIRLFAKIRNLLRPGGILVLEPQQWKSYKSNRLVSEVTRQHFDEIVLRPDQFKEILLDRIGFRTMERVTDNIADSTKGFSRPIFLVRR